MAPPTAASPSRLLVVEGENDEHVARHIWRRHQEASPFCVSSKGGVNRLLDSIGAEVKAPGRRAIGFLVDADDDPSARWSALADRLRKEDIALPRDPVLGGTIAGDRPRVGIWMMPDNRSAGELEDFVVRMIPEDDPVWPLSQEYIEGIPPEDRKFREGKMQRAKVHSWLAAREDPRPMGQAVRTRDLEVDGDLCRSFVTWLERLFA